MALGGDSFSSSLSTQREAAWEAADVTMQKVEAAVRGYAHLINGTVWNRWVPKESESLISASDALSLQHKLMDRIYEEGYAYMTVRAMRLEDMLGKKQSVELEEDERGNSHRSDRRRLSILDDDHNEEGHEEHEFANLLLGEDVGAEGERSMSQQKELPPSYMNDFALPGPTVAMYDAALDAVACSTAILSPEMDSVANAQNTLDTANHLHEIVMLRHITDGSDAANTNPHTRPTAGTFNALIRTVSELHYNNTRSAGMLDAEVQFRDDAVTTAITTFQAMHECGVVHRNSATYRYTLECVQKYMPASKIRSNIAAGMFHQARYAGLVNDSVVQAYISAITPPNEAGAHDIFIRDQLLPGQWPTK